MKNIRIKQLHIKDFKGVNELLIEFGNVTSIEGDNGLGKTSIFDAFTWLLFDKDSKNRGAFDIKPLDENNQVIKGLTPTVEGIFDCDGQVVKLGKIYKEKWVKKRGEVEPAFNGNETLYEVNDVPYKKKDYVAKVDEIVDEVKFKLLSNPYYFSENINWKDARKVVLSIAGDVDLEEIMKIEPSLKELEKDLANNEVDEILKSKKATSTKVSKEKKEIPVRINEIRNMYVEVDEKCTREEVKKTTDTLDLIKEAISMEEEKKNNSVKANQEIFDKINYLENKKRKINSEAAQKFYDDKEKIQRECNDIKSKMNSLEYQLTDIKCRRDSILIKIEKNNNEMSQLRDKFAQINREKPNLEQVDLVCPTCQRPFENTDIVASKDEIVRSFNENKAHKLESINVSGKAKREEVEKYEQSIKDLDVNGSKLKSNIEELREMLQANEESMQNLSATSYVKEYEAEISAIDDELKILESQKGQSYISPCIDDLLLREKHCEQELLELNLKLKDVDRNKQLDARIEELSKEEKEVGIKLAQIEKQIMLCELFIKTRVNLLEDNINSKFKNVSFKMFKEQVNGGLEETCEALINGVPFSMANHASQINAGLDIINTLSDFYDIKVPCFIDNAECINNIIDTKGQLIKLIVSNDKKIVVEVE